MNERVWPAGDSFEGFLSYLCNRSSATNIIASRQDKLVNSVLFVSFNSSATSIVHLSAG